MTDDDLALPIHRSATYRLSDDDYADLEAGRGQDALVYTRWGNPTNDAVAAEVADLEGFEEGMMTASGMAAIAQTLIGLLPSDGAVAATPVLYGGTRGLLDEELARLGIEVRYGDPGDGLADAADGADVVYTEPITNPTLRVTDLPEVAAIADEADATLVVDSTFATPELLTPVDHGADVVVHSATKYLAGHSDVVAGCLATDGDRWDRIWSSMIHLGGCLDPGAAYLVGRGLKTLTVRMERHCDNAQAVAEFLADDPRVEAVHHPGLPDHPDHARAAKLLDGFGGMVAFDAGSLDEGRRVLGGMEVFAEASSLGGVESLASMPALTSHRGMDPDERRELGIADGLVRLSVGIEPVQALLDDLDGAL